MDHIKNFVDKDLPILQWDPQITNVFPTSEKYYAALRVCIGQIGQSGNVM